MAGNCFHYILFYIMTPSSDILIYNMVYKLSVFAISARIDLQIRPLDYRYPMINVRIIWEL